MSWKGEIMNNKKIILGIIMFLIIGVCLFLGSNNKLSKLPKPEVTGGERGTLGIDKNIN